MTAPGDGLEETLRRGLADALGQVEPSADGLERIHARIGGRPPRPWLLAVGADALAAARHWVWRGHWSWQWSWAWPTALPAAVGGAVPRVPWSSLPRLRRLPRPGELLRPGPARSPRTAPVVDVGWLRPIGVLAAIVLIASVSFGVQPFRQAIIQASNTVLSGGGPSGQRRRRHRRQWLADEQRNGLTGCGHDPDRRPRPDPRRGRDLVPRCGVSEPDHLRDLRGVRHGGRGEHCAASSVPSGEGGQHRHLCQRACGGAAGADPHAVRPAVPVPVPDVRVTDPVGHAHPGNIGRRPHHVGNADGRRHVPDAHRVADADRYRQRQPDRDADR